MPIPELELVSHPLCPYVQRAVVTLLEKDIPHRRTYIDLAQKPDWFRQISPLGKVPLLKVGQDVLFESAVICEYLDEITPGSLHPADPLQKAQHRSWIEFGSSILNSIAGFYSAPSQAKFEQKRNELAGKFLRVEQSLNERSFEQPLGNQSYFAGPTFSLVDGVYGPIFRYFDVFDSIDEFGIFVNLPKLQQWRQLLQVRPSIQQAVSQDYPQRLLLFLRQRQSYLSTLIS